MTRRALPIVIDIAEPCPAAWDAMAGDEHRRLCDQCEKHVVNLSTVPADEVPAVLASGACITFEYRGDASIVTAPSRARRAAPAVVMAAALAATVGCNSVTRTTGEPPPPVSAASADQPASPQAEASSAARPPVAAHIANSTPQPIASSSGPQYSGDPPPEPRARSKQLLPKLTHRTAGIVAR